MLLLRKADVIPDSIPPIVFLATLYCLEVIKLFLLFSLVSWLPREIEWPLGLIFVTSRVCAIIMNFPLQIKFLLKVFVFLSYL